VLRKSLLLTASSLFVLLAAARAEACTCGGAGSPCQAFGGAAAVFVGRVTDISSRPRGAPEPGKEFEFDFSPRTVTFAVTEAFSGVEGGEVRVSTGLGGGDCGYSFLKGSTYLVYAHASGSGERRRLGTSICTRTQLAFGASEDLEYLRGLAVSPPGVTVSGRVERPGGAGAGEDGAPAAVGLSGIRVTIEGGGERRELVTDARGDFRLSGLGAGKYKVAVHPPDELTVYQPEREFELRDRGCAVTHFHLTDNGRVGGRVLDAEGRPAAGVNVGVVDADGRNPEFRYGRHTSTDAEGRYKFEGLPPGRYLLGLHVAGFPQPDDPTNAYPRTYYPGAARREEAEVLEIKAGEELKGRDLRLPPRRAESVIRVRVVWSDGTPVVNATVTYRDMTYADPQINYSAQADERGEFTLKGYVGGVYRVEARNERPYQGDPRQPGPGGAAKPVTLTAASPVETVTLVIAKPRP